MPVANEGKDVGVENYTGLLVLAFSLLLLWTVFSRTRRQQRVLAQAQAAAEPGRWVMTTSGLYGKVVSADDGPTVLLEVSPGVHTRWAKLAIAEVFDEDPAAGAGVVDLTGDEVPAHPDRDDRTHP